MSRNSINSADNICYICGEVTFTRLRKVIAAIVKKACHLYFGCKIGDQDKSCDPHICCRTTILSQWLNDERHKMPFVFPMVWREPSNHTTDCYFYMVPPVSGGITKKKKWKIVYPNIPTAFRPVPHGEGISFPEPPKEFTADSDDEDEGNSTSRTNASRPRVPLSLRRQLNHMSPTVGLLCHSRTFSHRMNWTIFFAIWSCPREEQSYWNQDLNNGIFSRKTS